MDHAVTARRTALLPAVLLAGGIWGCGAGGGSAPDPFRGDAGMQRVRISVSNLNWSDATLFALRGAERRRLGVVGGKGEEEFVLHWPTPSSLRIEIHLRTGESCVTRELQVRPGGRVSVQVESDLSLDPDCRRRGTHRPAA